MQRIDGLLRNELVAFIVAAVITTVVYVPLAGLLTGARTQALAQSLVTLQEHAPHLHQAVVVGVPELAGWMGERGVWLDVGAVEYRARQAKAGLSKAIEEARESAVATGSTTQPTEPDETIAGVLSGMSTSGWSRFFGYEQYACYVLSLWVALVLWHRWDELKRESKHLHRRLVEAAPGQVFMPEQVPEVLDSVHRAVPASSWCGTLVAGVLDRFATSRDVAAATATLQSECEGYVIDQDTRLAMIRYAIWAVPSIGFIGTVRGMGMALSAADNPAKLPEVVGYLAVAFDTTLVALLLSIVLMFATHAFQKAYELLAQRVHRKLEAEVLHRLFVPARGEAVLVGGDD